MHRTARNLHIRAKYLQLLNLYLIYSILLYRIRYYSSALVSYHCNELLILNYQVPTNISN